MFFGMSSESTGSVLRKRAVRRRARNGDPGEQIAMVIATSPRAGSCRSKQSVCAQYVFLLLFATLFTLSVFASTVVFRGEDHVGSIPLDGDPSWYQDLGGEFVTEIQTKTSSSTILSPR
jgi:hypothetical protein